MKYHKVPDETVRRLPVYLKTLKSLAQESKLSISSKKLADLLGMNSWQIRKDFAYFGDLGTRGVGYDVAKLTNQIKKILRLNVTNRVALVGFGNLGAALFTYQGFANYDFEIAAVFDSDAKKIGKKIKNIVVEDACKISRLRTRNIRFAIIAFPEKATQQVVDLLVMAGVKGILSFSSCHNIVVPKKIKVAAIDISTDLASLPYYVT